MLSITTFIAFIMDIIIQSDNELAAYKDGVGDTPLHKAAMAGSTTVAQVIIDHLNRDCCWFEK